MKSEVSSTITNKISIWQNKKVNDKVRFVGQANHYDKRCLEGVDERRGHISQCDIHYPSSQQFQWGKLSLIFVDTIGLQENAHPSKWPY